MVHWRYTDFANIKTLSKVFIESNNQLKVNLLCALIFLLFMCVIATTTKIHTK